MSTPLAMHLICGELQRFGCFEQLDDKIDELVTASADLHGLYKNIFQRVIEDFEEDFPGIVPRVLQLLAVSRCGLSKDEMTEMLGILPHDFTVVWAQIKPFTLQETDVHAAGLILNRFVNPMVSRVVRELLFSESESEATCHKFATCFYDQRYYSKDRGLEALWHLHHLSRLMPEYASVFVEKLSDLTLIELVFQSSFRPQFLALSAKSSFLALQSHTPACDWLTKIR